AARGQWMILGQGDQDSLTPEGANVIVGQRHLASYDQNVDRAVSQCSGEACSGPFDSCQFYQGEPVLVLGQCRSQIACGNGAAAGQLRAAGGRVISPWFRFSWSPKWVETLLERCREGAGRS